MEAVQTLKAVFDIPAVGVFLGTLPLLGTILWGLIQNDRRLLGIDKRIDGLDRRMDRMETRLDGIEGKITGMSERLIKVETRLEGGPLVYARS